GGLDRHHVGREPFRGEFEARRRAGGRLEEQVDDRAAAQGRELLHLPLQRVLEAVCSREQPLDVLAREVLDREQVPPGRTKEVVHALSSSGAGINRTWSTSSTSISCTWMRSLRAVGRFLPT